MKMVEQGKEMEGKSTVMTKPEFVCAWCDVSVRVPCNLRDDQGRIVSTYTCCAYCGRTELRFGKLGRQTPIPKDESKLTRLKYAIATTEIAPNNISQEEQRKDT